jgi:hypothetical protein
VTHFSDIDLQQWRDAGPGADRERVVAHLAVCAACAARYADAIRSRPLQAPGQADAPAGFDAADFVAAGVRAAARPTVVPFRRLRWILPQAAAAVLAIAFVIPRGTRDDGAPPTFRGGGIHALSPSGVVDRAGVEFVWSSAIAADRFQIDIGDATGVLYSGVSTTPRMPMPRAVADRLRPGVDCWWTVTALDRSGAPVTKSERRTFSVRP